MTIESEDAGCLIITGLAVLAVGTGTAFGLAVGCIVFGVSLIVLALLSQVPWKPRPRDNQSTETRPMDAGD